MNILRGIWNAWSNRSGLGSPLSYILPCCIYLAIRDGISSSLNTNGTATYILQYFLIILVGGSDTKEWQIPPVWHHLIILVKQLLCLVFLVGNSRRKQQLFRTKIGILYVSKVNVIGGTSFQFFSDLCLIPMLNLFYIHTAVYNPHLLTEFKVRYF